MHSENTTSNHAAYKRLREEAERVGWPMYFATDLTEVDKALLYGTNGAPIPHQFGWHLHPLGTTLAPVGSVEGFEFLAEHKTTRGEQGEGNYYYDDGKTLRRCTLDELLAWLGQRLDPKPYAAAVAAAAEACWEAAPTPECTDNARHQAYGEATHRWEAAKAVHERAVEIVEEYRR